jgi:hypothetical protein
MMNSTIKFPIATSPVTGQFQVVNYQQQKGRDITQYYGNGMLPATTFWGWQVNSGH